MIKNKLFIFNQKYWRQSSQIKTWLPKLQSHRGYWVKGIQQNTIESIQKSYELGFKMVEFDVRITRDHQVVLFHDEKFESRNIDILSFEELTERLEAKNFRLDTLERLFIWFCEEKESNPSFDFKLNIEIKSKKPLNGTIDYLVVELIEKYDLVDDCLISSFNPMSLFRVRKKNDKIRRALLLTESAESNLIANNMWLNPLCKPDILHLRYQDFKPSRYAALARHIPVVLWTVNRTEIYAKHKSHIFGIISDEIDPKQFLETEVKI